MKTNIISLFFAVTAGLSLLTTGCSANKENGHEYVDLGLSVKWATCNVGANAPEEYGNYYAWGEVQPKDDYNCETYEYINSTKTSLTKYCTNSNYGTVDYKRILEAMDDAAAYNWGGSWRMPTDAEWQELIDNCTWIWTTRDGICGYEVKSKFNGNAIFLPTAGFSYDTDFIDAGSDGSYWSSSSYEGEPRRAWNVNFNSDDVSRDIGIRYCGQSVRPVCQ